MPITCVTPDIWPHFDPRDPLPLVFETLHWCCPKSPGRWMGSPKITQLGSRVGSRYGYSGPVIPDVVWMTGKEER